MKNYELLYIVSSQFTDNEVPAVKEKVNALLQKNGAVIGYEEFIGKRKLAYPIKKSLHGYYIAAEFELEDGSKIKELNETLKLDKDVLRAQIIAKAKITQAEIERKKRHAEEPSEVSGEAPAEKSSPIEPMEEEKKTAKTPDKKIKMKDLDEKLDEILQDNNLL